ncbi:MAG: hypothetical protein KC766_33950, partial [Myxococcales bacterium]|nr:hypothetical protein [Myxococcales bacterium]
MREIDELLDARELDRAATALMQLGEIELFRHATAYLTTRLLFLRGRLDAEEVAQRLEDLLKEVTSFPEATTLLEAARSGELTEFGTARKLKLEKEARRSEAAATQRRDSEPHHQVLTQAAIVHHDSDAPIPDEPDLGDAGTEDDLDLTPSASEDDLGAAIRPSIPKAPGLPRAWAASSETNAEQSGEPAWVIPSLGPRAARPMDSLPIPDLPPSLRAGASTVPPLDQLGPKLTDAGSSAALHVSSVPPPPRVPAPPNVPAPEPSRQAQVMSPAEPALSSNLSDGSQRPGPTPGPVGVAIPRAPAVPNLIPRANEVEPAGPGGGSLSPSGEYPAIEFTAYDPLKRKSQLPPRAGLYSSTPAAPEVSDAQPRAAVREAQPKVHNLREVRSVPPPPDPGTSLFQLASWLDEGHPDRVLDAAQPHASDPEQRLMRCRALIQLGRDETAATELEALGAFPLLEPEVRASVARLLIELGLSDQALHQADQAYRDDPESDPARLALAWAAVRVDRRHNEPIWVKRAHTALAALSTDQNPYPALTLALRSCVLASIGEADKAISVAQRALGLDPDSVDAVAAIALAAARLGRGRDAQEAWCRLLDLDHREADALSATLTALGVAP